MTDYPNLFSPVRIGSMELRNRVMVPPHTALMGPLWGTQEQADQHVAYIRARSLADSLPRQAEVRNRIVDLLTPAEHHTVLNRSERDKAASLRAACDPTHR